MNVDRVTRNFRDAIDLDEMRKKDGLAIHFVQDGFVLDSDANGADLFMWEAKVFIAKQYLNRLTDDAKRSIRHKIEHGEWIAKAPIGYRNVTDEITNKQTVVVDNERAFFIRRITQNEYDKKAYELKQRKHELSGQLENYTQADEEFALSVSALLSLASKAVDLFESSELDQKRKLLSFVFSNLRLNAGKLEYALNRPFDAFVKNNAVENWRPLLHTLRTEYFRDVIALSVVLPSIARIA